MGGGGGGRVFRNQVDVLRVVIRGYRSRPAIDVSSSGKGWRVERLFAWFHNFRRLVTRWKYHVENFLGMVHLACLKLLLKHL